MKYLAVFVLSLASRNQDGAAVTFQAVQTTAAGDTALMLLLAGALIALQLRRRQKSLRTPRLAT